MIRMTTIALAMLAMPFTAVTAAQTYTIDPAHTYPYFKISHLGFSTMQGRFNSTSGTITVDMDNGTGSVDITIDAESIDTAHEDRDDHLRSPDFLNAMEFPEITYKSTEVTIHDDNTATVKGNLTIMGTTKPVTLDVTHIKCGPNPMNDTPTCGFDAHTTIKRTDFGMTFGVPAIGDEMKLEFAVEAIR